MIFQKKNESNFFKRNNTSDSVSFIEKRVEYRELVLQLFVNIQCQNSLTMVSEPLDD